MVKVLPKNIFTIRQTQSAIRRSVRSSRFHIQITLSQQRLVGLVAPNVENHGVIQARLGKVQLASGDQFSVDLYGDGLYEVAVSDAVTSQLVANTGQISAEGGTIALTAVSGRDMVNSLIHVEGELSAPSIQQHEGRIIIAAEGSNAVIGNIADVKGSRAGASVVTMGNAFLDVSGRQAGVRGGRIDITADHVGLFAGSILDASGTAPVPIAKPMPISPPVTAISAVSISSIQPTSPFTAMLIPNLSAPMAALISIPISSSG